MRNQARTDTETADPDHLLALLQQFDKESTPRASQLGRKQIELHSNLQHLLKTINDVCWDLDTAGIDKINISNETAYRIVKHFKPLLASVQATQNKILSNITTRKELEHAGITPLTDTSAKQEQDTLTQYEVPNINQLNNQLKALLKQRMGQNGDQLADFLKTLSTIKLRCAFIDDFKTELYHVHFDPNQVLKLLNSLNQCSVQFRYHWGKEWSAPQQTELLTHMASQQLQSGKQPSAIMDQMASHTDKDAIVDWIQNQLQFDLNSATDLFRELNQSGPGKLAEQLEKLNEAISKCYSQIKLIGQTQKVDGSLQKIKELAGQLDDQYKTINWEYLYNNQPMAFKATQQSKYKFQLLKQRMYQNDGALINIGLFNHQSNNDMPNRSFASDTPAAFIK